MKKLIMLAATLVLSTSAMAYYSPLHEASFNLSHPEFQIWEGNSKVAAAFRDDFRRGRFEKLNSSSFKSNQRAIFPEFFDSYNNDAVERFEQSNATKNALIQITEEVACKLWTFENSMRESSGCGEAPRRPAPTESAAAEPFNYTYKDRPLEVSKIDKYNNLKVTVGIFEKNHRFVRSNNKSIYFGLHTVGEYIKGNSTSSKSLVISTYVTIEGYGADGQSYDVLRKPDQKLMAFIVIPSQKEIGNAKSPELAARNAVNKAKVLIFNP